MWLDYIGNGGGVIVCVVIFYDVGFVGGDYEVDFVGVVVDYVFD